MIGSGVRVLPWLMLGCVCLPAPASADAAATTPPATVVEASPAGFVPHLRTGGDRFEIVSGGVASPFTIRGVNLGAGAPGHFPGEFGFTREDYARFIRFARDLNANALRVYTLHPPAFYEALREENLAHPDRPVWLFQGVWTELPASNDFWDPGFTDGFERDLECAVDAVHGRADVAPRPGHAAGRYAADVSPWLAGWLVGREWEPYAVRETDQRHPDFTSYAGDWFTVAGGSATEVWLARMCDRIVSWEHARYGVARAVSFVSWPTLDVMEHPTEHEAGGGEAHHDEDAVSVDPTRIRPTRSAGWASGFLGYYASYHVYPYYPDFLNLDPGYSAHRDRHGVCNYAGYLADLKAHTPGLPLLIAEYGVPTSRGISHLQPQGLHHGGASDAAQGARIVRLVEDIRDAGCAGSLLFSLFDEWFKTNWLAAQKEQPRDRDPLWYNPLDPEEGYGLIAFDPSPPIRVDGEVSDWRGIAPYATAPRARTARAGARPVYPPMVRALYVTSDAAHLFLRLDVDPRSLGGRAQAFGVALDMLDPRRGDVRLPAPLDASWSRGAEYVLVVDPGRRGGKPARAELFSDRRMGWSDYGRLRVGNVWMPTASALQTQANDDGLYAPLVVNVNRERVSASGVVYPGMDVDMGRLSLGRPRRAPATHESDTVRWFVPGAEWWIDRARGVIEIAIPWSLLNVSDPSSLAVLDDRPETPEIEVARTHGIGLLAFATRAPGFRADSLGPTRAGARPATRAETDFLGPDATLQVTVGQHVRVATPDSISYLWNGWQRPITRERVKASAEIVRNAFREMDARESRTRREFNANAIEPGRPRRGRPRGPARGARRRGRGPGRPGRPRAGLRGRLPRERSGHR